MHCSSSMVGEHLALAQYLGSVSRCEGSDLHLHSVAMTNWRGLWPGWVLFGPSKGLEETMVPLESPRPPARLALPQCRLSVYPHRRSYPGIVLPVPGPFPEYP
eukprot:scaffold2911_cov414-Prasinococcus_capsulatus_cf.AAC.32